MIESTRSELVDGEEVTNARPAGQRFTRKTWGGSMLLGASKILARPFRELPYKRTQPRSQNNSDAYVCDVSTNPVRASEQIRYLTSRRFARVDIRFFDS